LINTFASFRVVNISLLSPAWIKRYAKKQKLERAVGVQNIVRINHIGSTTMSNLIAKPTIDILLEIKDDTDTKELISKLKSIGFIYSEQPKNPAPHMMFMKGYTPQGFKGQAFHLHVRYSGDWDELYFRDYLLIHPEIAQEYGRLKLGLLEKFEHDRDAYTVGKTEFIRRITALARTESQVKL
jgi:GrpB-like predicted nucleotidyltransferase (UPF0157 family)